MMMRTTFLFLLVSVFLLHQHSFAAKDALEGFRNAVRAKIYAARVETQRIKLIGDDLPVDGKDGWIFSGRRMKQLLFETDLSAKDPVGEARLKKAETVLLHAKQQCDALGIRFLVVIAPDKSDIYPERLGPVPAGQETVNLRSAKFYARLRKAGLEILDLEAGLKSRKGKESGPLYMHRDTHWSPAGARFAAAETAKHLQDFRSKKSKIEERPNQTFVSKGDLAENWARTGRKKFPKEEHSFVGVTRGRGRPVLRRSGAKVLVLGDSFSEYPYDGYFGYWAFLSHQLGGNVDHRGRSGGGTASLASFHKLKPENREKVKAIVLLFTHCALYENDAEPVWLSGKGKAGDVVIECQGTVRLLHPLPAIDAKTVDYANVDVSVPATVDWGDGEKQPVNVVVPVLRERKYRPTAKWPVGKGRMVTLRSHPPTSASAAPQLIEVGDSPVDATTLYIEE